MKISEPINPIRRTLILLVLAVSVWATFRLPGMFAQAAVMQDASTIRIFENSSSVLWTHTTSGNDRLLIVGVSYYNFGGGRTVSSVTYAGTALTKLASLRQNSVTAELWYLTAPGVGSSTIRITVGGGAAWGVAGATSWTGVNQATPLGAPIGIGGNTATPSLAVTSAQGEVVQDVLVWDREVASPPQASIGANQSRLWASAGLYSGGASSHEAGASSVTMSWNLSNAVNWALIAVPIKPLIVAPDTVPPFRSNGSPSGTLPSGTTSTTLSLATNESASCRYSDTAGTDFTAMAGTFSTANGTNHSTTAILLSDGNSYTFYARCQDTAGNVNPDDFIITFAVAAPDRTPPFVSGVQATSLYAAGATILWTTDEAADSQVEYGTTLAYGNQTPLNTALTTNHSQVLSGLSSDTLHHYRVRSSDASGNLAISNDFTFTTSSTSARPNIIVITTDNQDRRSVAEAMPKVLQYLGQTGTEFTNAFVSYPLCCPSRASFLTGQLAHNHKVLDNQLPKGGYSRLDNNNTLAVWLSTAGYHTAAIGKYLNQYGVVDTNPNDSIPACREIPPGWTEWYGAVNNDIGKFYNFILNENGQLFAYGSASISGCTVTSKTAVYQTDLYSQKAVDFINRRATAPDGKPFFLYLSYSAVHGESPDGKPGPDPAPRHTGLFSTRSLPTPPSFNEADVSDKPWPVRLLPLLSSTKISNLTTEYRRRLEALLSVDEGLENIVNTLSATGQLANTVVIFTSDQGQNLGEHRLDQGLGWVYDESIQVPLFVRGPGFAAGQLNGTLTLNIDLTATLLELAQATPTRTMDGRSLMPLISDPTTPWRTAAYIHAEFADRVYKGVRTLQYLYNEASSGEEIELYDLLQDPYQLTSKHNDPAYQQIRQSLQQILNQLKVCSGSTCWK